MRILLLSDVNSPHTQKWAMGLSSAGCEVGVFSLSVPAYDWFSKQGIKTFIQHSQKKNIFNSFDIFKISYLKSISFLKKAIAEFKPDIVHAHYATSYGMLGSLSRFHPFFLSVWGSDVLSFPQKSIFHKRFVRRNLRKADYVSGVSKFLGEAVFNISGMPCLAVPFGIDTDVFKPLSVQKPFGENTLVIGTVKSLEKIYNIDILIRVFARLYSKYPELNLRLLLVGKGAEEMRLKQMVHDAGLNDVVLFTGKVSHERVPEYHNMIDVFSNLSDYEGFGVTVVEASSCGKPVVTTNVGGLPETVVDGKTGFLVPADKNEEAITEAFEKLVLDKNLREEMGKAGRQFVIDNYEWKKCLEKMIGAYKSSLQR